MKIAKPRRNTRKELELKAKIQDMPTKVLINEWKNVREINQCCSSTDLPNCKICSQKNNYFYYFIYEKVLTEEIIARGLFYFALISLAKKTNKQQQDQRLPLTTQVTAQEQIIWPN